VFFVRLPEQAAIFYLKKQHLAGKSTPFTSKLDLKFNEATIETLH
jgi:hypothetical protein